MSVTCLERRKKMSETFTIETTKPANELSFWYEYKPFINAKDGSMELKIDHKFLGSDELEDFDFKNPQIDPVDLSKFSNNNKWT